MRRRWKLVLSGVFPALTGPAWAVPLACPPMLQVTQTPQTVPPGFTAYVDGNPPLPVPSIVALPLDKIMFSEGAPDKQVWLAPTTQAGLVAVWDFESSGDRNMWMSCGYRSTTLLVSAPLPAGVKTCRVRDAKNGAGSPALLCHTP